MTWIDLFNTQKPFLTKGNVLETRYYPYLDGTVYTETFTTWDNKYELIGTESITIDVMLSWPSGNWNLVEYFPYIDWFE